MLHRFSFLLCLAWAPRVEKSRLNWKLELKQYLEKVVGRGLSTSRHSGRFFCKTAETPRQVTQEILDNPNTLAQYVGDKPKGLAMAVDELIKAAYDRAIDVAIQVVGCLSTDHRVKTPTTESTRQASNFPTTESLQAMKNSKKTIDQIKGAFDRIIGGVYDESDEIDALEGEYYENKNL